MRGNEIVKGQKIRCYDSGGTGDRYTVVYMDDREGEGLHSALGMNSIPFHPCFGIGQHCAAKIGRHLGKRVPFASLPEDCQTAVLRDVN